MLFCRKTCFSTVSSRPERGRPQMGITTFIPLYWNPRDLSIWKHPALFPCAPMPPCQNPTDFLPFPDQILQLFPILKRILYSKRQFLPADLHRLTLRREVPAMKKHRLIPLFLSLLLFCTACAPQTPEPPTSTGSVPSPPSRNRRKKSRNTPSPPTRPLPGRWRITRGFCAWTVRFTAKAKTTSSAGTAFSVRTRPLPLSAIPCQPLPPGTTQQADSWKTAPMKQPFLTRKGARSAITALVTSSSRRRHPCSRES